MTDRGEALPCAQAGGLHGAFASTLSQKPFHGYEWSCWRHCCNDATEGATDIGLIANVIS